MRSFLNLQRAELGFDARPITTVRLFMPGDAYGDGDAKARRVADILRRVEAIPGVVAAGASNLIPLDGGGSTSRVEDGSSRVSPRIRRKRPLANSSSVETTRGCRSRLLGVSTISGLRQLRFTCRRKQ